MKRFLPWLAAAAIGGLGLWAAGAQQYATAVRITDSGNKLVIASGGTIDVESGGNFKIAGTAVSATAANLNGIRTGQKYQLSGYAKAGTTAGWVVNAGDNLWEHTLPASQSASTLVLPVSGLHVGDTITAFQCEAQIESAGGAVTLDGDLRKLTNVAADPSDASVGTWTQVSVTADTKAEPEKASLAEVVAADERFYILVTATTAGSTDIRLLGCNVTVTTS